MSQSIADDELLLERGTLPGGICNGDLNEAGITREPENAIDPFAGHIEPLCDALLGLALLVVVPAYSCGQYTI
ncbi:MAG TPA: hypothetical protein VFR21_16825, partial [Bradyrhizobium sp.]|nr:hypothetical protein [Bradyrhizobium sp.]